MGPAPLDVRWQEHLTVPSTDNNRTNVSRALVLYCL